ncbi:MAG: class I SAM-dependent methyltransferase [Patescibacteria group bacterium]
MVIQENQKICPVCLEGKELGFIRDYKLKEGDFSLYQCKKCQAQFYDPFLKIKGKNYQEKNSYEINEAIKPKIFRKYHKKFLERNKSFKPGANVLDLGCGTGEFLNELKKRGCNVFGADFDQNAVFYAKKYFNLKNVYAEPFEEFFNRKNLPKFDFIFMFEVLQYIDNPKDIAEKIKQAMGNKGKLVLSAPSRKRALANMDIFDYPSRCLTKWDKGSILNLFLKQGFKASYITYVEQLKILIGAINSKARFGLVSKAINMSKKNKSGNFLNIKLVYFLGRAKGFIIAFMPAVILWIFGKITKRENGIIYVEFEKKI